MPGYTMKSCMIGGILSLGLFCAAISANDGLCLRARLDDMRLDRPVTLYTVDGTKVEGRLITADFNLNRLLIEEIPLSGRDASFEFIELDKIRFKVDDNRLKPGWLIGGAAAGVLVGVLAGYHSEDDSTGRPAAMIGGGFVGGLAGMLAGTVYSLVKTTKTVECRFR